MDQRHAVLDVCDIALRETGQRDATWPWLREDDGTLFAVDGWWPRAEVAIVLVREEHGLPPGDRLTPLLRTLDAHGIRAVPIPSSSWMHETRDELEIALGGIGDEDFLLHLRAVWGLEPERSLHAFVPVIDEWPDDEDGDDEWEADDEWLDEDEPVEPSHAPDLGWRTRPTLLALLGAAALTRRAADLAADLASDDRGTAFEVLGVLGLHAADAAQAAHGASVTGIQATLGIDRWEIREAAETLLRAGLAERVEQHETGDAWFAITPAGTDALLVWIRRCGQLVAGWPPDHPQADDAV